MFYKNLARVYEHVFPAFNKIRFIDAHIKPNAKILDVGCSDGRMALGLTSCGHCVDAFDLSEDMVAVAKVVSNNQAHFNVRVDNMLNLPSCYIENEYDSVVCTGNTLVHLKDNKEISLAIKGFYTTLKQGGMLIIQILNYDKVYRDQITSLPLIENDMVYFKRSYILNKKDITFIASLKIKAEDTSYYSKTTLYPLRYNELLDILKTFNFQDIKIFSDYDGGEYNEDKLPLIITAIKA